MRIRLCLLCALLLVGLTPVRLDAAPESASDAAAPESADASAPVSESDPSAADSPERPASRPWHLVAALGGYASLSGPASYGPSMALDILPGGPAGRFGVRGEWRGYEGIGEGSTLLGLVYEAGASRPKLALHLVAELGLTGDREPIVGGGVETCLWLLGPLGLATMADVQIIVDGLGTRPALSFGIALQLGR